MPIRNKMSHHRRLHSYRCCMMHRQYQIYVFNIEGISRFVASSIIPCLVFVCMCSGWICLEIAHACNAIPLMKLLIHSMMIRYSDLCYFSNFLQSHFISLFHLCNSKRVCNRHPLITHTPSWKSNNQLPWILQFEQISIELFSLVAAWISSFSFGSVGLTKSRVQLMIEIQLSIVNNYRVSGCFRFYRINGQY